MPGERELKAKRLKWIEGLIRNDEFLAPNWYKGTERETADMLYRLDGQHTSNVLAEMAANGEFPQGLKVTVHTLEYDHNDRAVFELFNNPNVQRSSTDKVGIYCAEQADILHIARPFLQHIGDGLRSYYGDHRGRHRAASRDAGMYFRSPSTAHLRSASRRIWADREQLDSQAQRTGGRNVRRLSQVEFRLTSLGARCARTINPDRETRQLVKVDDTQGQEQRQGGRLPQEGASFLNASVGYAYWR